MDAREAGYEVQPGAPRLPPFLVIAGAVAWRVLVIAAVVWLVIKLVVDLSLVIVPLILALIIASFTYPPAEWLREHGLPSILAALAVFVFGLAVVIAIAYWVIPRMIEQLQQFDEIAQQARNFLENGPLGLTQQQVQSAIDQVSEAISSGAPSLIRRALGRVLTVFEIFGSFILMLVLAFFFTKDGERITSWLRRQLPEPHRGHVAEGASRAWSTLSAYVRGNVLVGLAEAFMFAVALLVIGVPLVIPIAVIAFFGGFIPFAGVIFTGLVAAVIALLTGGVIDMLLVLAALAVVQQVEGNVLEPVILGRALNLHPIVILTVVGIGLLQWGIIGALLAVPITAALSEVVGYVREMRASEGDEEEEREAEAASA